MEMISCSHWGMFEVPKSVKRRKRKAPIWTDKECRDWVRDNIG